MLADLNIISIVPQWVKSIPAIKNSLVWHMDLANQTRLKVCGVQFLHDCLNVFGNGDIGRCSL